MACHQVHTANNTGIQQRDFTTCRRRCSTREKQWQTKKIRQPGYMSVPTKCSSGPICCRNRRYITKGKNSGFPEIRFSALCTQCHAPNAAHEAGSQDDRTPAGVHEGLSCIACHANHSNDATGFLFKLSSRDLELQARRDHDEYDIFQQGK